MTEIHLPTKEKVEKYRKEKIQWEKEHANSLIIRKSKLPMDIQNKIHKRIDDELKSAELPLFHRIGKYFELLDKYLTEEGV